jgi:hypothetical protein
VGVSANQVCERFYRGCVSLLNEGMLNISDGDCSSVCKGAQYLDDTESMKDGVRCIPAMSMRLSRGHRLCCLRLCLFLR